jgi:hypothetical protein
MSSALDYKELTHANFTERLLRVLRAKRQRRQGTLLPHESMQAVEDCVALAAFHTPKQAVVLRDIIERVDRDDMTIAEAIAFVGSLTEDQTL